MRFVVGAALAGAVALAAGRLHALTRSGAFAAWFVGTCVFAAGSWSYAAVLFAFFIPSTLVSRAGRSRKRALQDAVKAGPRDARQVAANGAVAAICAVLAALTGNGVYAAAFAGAFAAASSDTWGTEIGTLAKNAPRSIVTGRPVPPGISGGITLTGTLAEIAGALAPALVAGTLGIGAWWCIAVGGCTGALADSILGATLQHRRVCRTCGRRCEVDVHACGTPTAFAGGIPWMNNDAVNACATATGAIAAAVLSMLFSGS